MIELHIDQKENSKISIEIENNLVPYDTKNNIIVIDSNATNIKLHVEGTVTVNDIVYNDIKVGLVTFLCTTVKGLQNTQATNDIIEINVEHPIWEFWCKRLNSFNYKDYPLGSIN